MGLDFEERAKGGKVGKKEGWEGGEEGGRWGVGSLFNDGGVGVGVEGCWEKYNWLVFLFVESMLGGYLVFDNIV